MKRPLNPYFQFMKLERPKIVKEFPDITAAQVVKILKERYEKLDPKEMEKL